MPKESVFSSFLFKAIESFGTQGIAFVVNILLARLLDPSDYGLLTLLAVFISISRVFISSGLNTALIQKPVVEEADYHSSFCFSLGLSGLLYALLFLFAPSIAQFYNNPALAPVLQVLALVLFPGSYSLVQQAKIARERRFGELMKSSLMATLLSGILGIALAMQGFGYWALVAQQLSSQLFQVLFLGFSLQWWPRLQLERARLQSLLAFGWKLLVSGLVDVVYENLRALIIGKQYTEADLGYYNRGRQFPELIISSINASIQSVMLPVLASTQDKAEAFGNYLRKSIQVSSVLVFPMMTGLALVAKPLVEVLLGEKWLPAVPFLILACLDFSLYPLHSANLQALNAKGRSDLFLKLEIIKKVYGIAILLLSIFIFRNIYVLVAGASLSSLLSYFVNAYPNGKLVDYGINKQVKDLLPAILISLDMGFVVFLLGLLPLASLPLLILQCMAGLLSFLLFAWLHKAEGFTILLDLGKRLLSKGN